MDNEKQFLEKLNGIKAFAETKNNRVTTKEIEQYFTESSLTEEQIVLVYDYLLAQKITVVGYTKVGKRAGDAAGNTAENSAEKAVGKLALTLDEENYLKEYKKDLSEVKAEQPGEKMHLFGQAAGGDALAKSRLIELYLPTVLDISREMHDGTVFLGDMVQEGNVSLILALDMITDAESAEALILEEIRQGIQTMVEEQAELKRRDRKMVHQVNELDETIQNLKKDRGREITIEELAEYMKISEEEILNIIKLAGEDLKDRGND